MGRARPAKGRRGSRSSRKTISKKRGKSKGHQSIGSAVRDHFSDRKIKKLREKTYKEVKTKHKIYRVPLDAEKLGKFLKKQGRKKNAALQIKFRDAKGNKKTVRTRAVSPDEPELLQDQFDKLLRTHSGPKIVSRIDDIELDLWEGHDERAEEFHYKTRSGKTVRFFRLRDPETGRFISEG